MRIGIDNISPGMSTSASALGGMRHWLQSVVGGLSQASPSIEFALFSPVWSDRLGRPLASNVTDVADLKVPRNQIARAVYEQLWLPRRIRARNVSVWLGTCNTLPLRVGCRTVLVIQSIQYQTHPDAYGIVRRTYLRIMLRLSVKRADAVVVFSEACRRQLMGWFGIDGSRVHVIPHACRFLNLPPAAPTEKQDVYATTGGPFILCVSAFYPFKNLMRLIEAYACLDRPQTHKLVLAGSPTAQVTVNDIRTKAREVGVEGNVMCLGRVSDEELPKLYRHAAVMAMPSLEETFGFPVLEAMGLGCPVVTSNLSSMPEIAGEAGILVDPYEVESITEGLRQVLRSSERREWMRKAGRARAELFTYDRFTQSLVRVLEGVEKQRLETVIKQVR